MLSSANSIQICVFVLLFSFNWWYPFHEIHIKAVILQDIIVGIGNPDYEAHIISLTGIALFVFRNNIAYSFIDTSRPHAYLLGNVDHVSSVSWKLNTIAIGASMHSVCIFNIIWLQKQVCMYFFFIVTRYGGEKITCEGVIYFDLCSALSGKRPDTFAIWYCLCLKYINFTQRKIFVELQLRYSCGNLNIFSDVKFCSANALAIFFSLTLGSSTSK